MIGVRIVTMKLEFVVSVCQIPGKENNVPVKKDTTLMIPE